MAWPAFLVGGLATIGLLVVVFPLMIMRGIAALADLLAHSEVNDEQT